MRRSRVAVAIGVACLALFLAVAALYRPAGDDPVMAPASTVESSAPAVANERQAELVAEPAAAAEVTVVEAIDAVAERVEYGVPELGEATEQAANRRPRTWPPGVEPAIISYERSVPDGGYTPGEPLDVYLVMDYPGDALPITAVGVVERLPPGWAFEAVNSDPKPTLLPRPGATGKLEFAWAKLPVFPFQFSYTVRVPESEGGGTREITGRTLFRAEGPERHSPEASSTLPRK